VFSGSTAELAAPAAVTGSKSATAAAASTTAAVTTTTLSLLEWSSGVVLLLPSAVDEAPASGSVGMVAGVRRGVFGGAAAEVAAPAAVACG